MTEIPNRIERTLRGSKVAQALGIDRGIEDSATEPGTGGDRERRLRRAIAASSVYRTVSAEPTNEIIRTDFSETLIVGPIFGVLTRAGNSVATCWRGSTLRRGIHRTVGRLEWVGPEWTRRTMHALFVPADWRRDAEERETADHSESDRASGLSGSMRE